VRLGATLLVALCAGCPKDEPAPPPAATAPADPIVRAKIAKTETVKIEPTPEMEAAAKKLGEAQRERDAIEAAQPKSTAERRAAAVEKCRKERPDGAMPGLALPASLPPPPSSAALCRAYRDDKDKRAIWFSYASTDGVEAIVNFYEDALLHRSHTVTRIGRDEGGPGLEFGDIVNGGGVLFASDGDYSIRWRPNDKRR
jgi:hypothetical protein